MNLIWCSEKIMKFGSDLIWRSEKKNKAIFAILRHLCQIFSALKFIPIRHLIFLQKLDKYVHKNIFWEINFFIYIFVENEQDHNHILAIINEKVIVKIKLMTVVTSRNIFKLSLQGKGTYSEFSGPYFPAFGQNRRDTRYFSIFSPNAGKYGPENLRIRTLFTQCIKPRSTQLMPLVYFWTGCKVVFTLFANLKSILCNNESKLF